jgi:hypothetical protein
VPAYAERWAYRRTNREARNRHERGRVVFTPVGLVAQRQSTRLISARSVGSSPPWPTKSSEQAVKARPDCRLHRVICSPSAMTTLARRGSCGKSGRSCCFHRPGTAAATGPGACPPGRAPPGPGDRVAQRDGIDCTTPRRFLGRATRWPVWGVPCHENIMGTSDGQDIRAEAYEDPLHQ